MMRHRTSIFTPQYQIPFLPFIFLSVLFYPKIAASYSSSTSPSDLFSSRWCSKIEPWKSSHRVLPPFRRKICYKRLIHFSSNNQEVSLESVDVTLAREIEDALSSAAEVEISSDLTSVLASSKGYPSASPMVMQERNKNKRDDDETYEGLTSQMPPPPQVPPPTHAISFGETLQKAVSNEIIRIKNLILGLEVDYEKSQSNTREAEIFANKLKKEIEESILQREALMNEIENQFSDEKNSLKKQLEISSGELQMIIKQSEQNITQLKLEAALTERDLLSRIEELNMSLHKLKEEKMTANLEKEKFFQSRTRTLEEVRREVNDDIAEYRSCLIKEMDDAKLYNSKLRRNLEEAEHQVRELYQSADRIRQDKIRIQMQINDVETESLRQITSLQQQLNDEERKYAVHLDEQTIRNDKLITKVKSRYAALLHEDYLRKESIKNDFVTELKRKDIDREIAMTDAEMKIKEELDIIEKKNSKERIAIYQQKVEAVSMVRQEMLAEIAIENAKLDSIHKDMQLRLDRVSSEIAKVKAENEQQLKERRQIAEKELNVFLNRLEDIRSDMLDKIFTQQKNMETTQSTYLQEQNDVISMSEEECRRAWRELAISKSNLSKIEGKRSELIDSIVRQTELISSYENDQTSFRKLLRMSIKLAREKIGKQIRRILKRKKEVPFQ